MPPSGETAMKFGLFYELIALRPHDEEAVRRAYRPALEQIQHAGQLGFEYGWTQHSFERHGRFWEVPARNVIPRPVQKPHPPLWVAGVSPNTFEIAADKGIGVLSFSLSAPGQSEAAVAMYKRRIKDAEPVGSF